MRPGPDEWYVLSPNAILIKPLESKIETEIVDGVLHVTVTTPLEAKIKMDEIVKVEGGSDGEAKEEREEG